MEKIKINLKLEIAKKDLEDILNLFDMNDTDIKTVLEYFLNDLVAGAKSHGADEQIQAKEYFERCRYGYGGDDTFTKFLISWDAIQAVTDFEELLEAKGFDDPCTCSTYELLKDFYKEYSGEYIRKNAPQTEKEALAEARKWYKNRQALLKELAVTA